MLSVKKMIDLYVSYELSEDTWDMLRNMSLHGLISSDNWRKFFDKCKDWSMDDDWQRIIDADGNTIYKRDKDGFLVKA